MTPPFLMREYFSCGEYIIKMNGTMILVYMGKERAG